MRIKKTIEVIMCDVCEGREANHKCPCGKDICSDCGIQVGSAANSFSNADALVIGDHPSYKPYGTICRLHIDTEILKKLKT